MTSLCWKCMNPRTMITQNLLFLIYSSLLILSAHFFQTCYAKCRPSSCGLIRNISYPFRLNTCRGPGYELVCENNVTLLYRKSRKYYVKEIDYQNHTIRLSEISTNNNICSLPSYTLDENSYFPYDYIDDFNQSIYYRVYIKQRIYLVRCEHPLHNTLNFPQLTGCEQYNTSKYTYIHVGNMRVKDMDNMCTLVSTLRISSRSANLNNLSLSEIHQSLLYGFDLSWFSFMCSYCKGGIWDCSHISDVRVECGHTLSQLYLKWVYVRDSAFRSPKGPIGGCLLILLLILAVVFGGLTIPLKIMITIGLGVLFWTESDSFWVPKEQQSIDVLPRWLHVKKPYSLSDVIFVSLEVRFIMGFLCGMCFLIYKFRRRHLSAYEDIESFLLSDNHLSPIRYSYSDIKKMTRNFREKLGEGGFGSVYKGKLRSGHYVAVKLLGKAKINDKDFINEIGTIGRIHHVNVVQLVGYCAERSKRALILDFMPNGSLDKYIFNPEKASSLDWGMKFKIAVGVARGIQYLHCGCDIKILHFDIKPHNILLDDKFVPKVSDFGLAKLCSVDKDTVTMTAARGTIGYVAPELINRSIGLVSHKADVYSFGMLLMEMAGVNRELRGNKDDLTKYFPDWIYDHINKGEVIGIIEEEDNNVDDENGIGKSVLEKMTIVGLWCIQMNPDNRPSMNKVLEMLEGDVEDLKIPEHPSHLVNEVQSRPADSASSVSQLDYDNGSMIEISIA